MGSGDRRPDPLPGEPEHPAGGRPFRHYRPNVVQAATTEEPLIEVVDDVRQVDVGLIVHADDRLFSARCADAHEVHEYSREDGGAQPRRSVGGQSVMGSCTINPDLRTRPRTPAYIHRAWMRRGVPHGTSRRPQSAIANTASDLTTGQPRK